jgi:transcriptional regulator with XRE-family HTH domain
MDLLKFKGFLAANKIKQAEIAKLLGISIVTANGKINGRIAFTIPEAKLICDHYHISFNDYFL